MLATNQQPAAAYGRLLAQVQCVVVVSLHVVCSAAVRCHAVMHDMQANRMACYRLYNSVVTYEMYYSASSPALLLLGKQAWCMPCCIACLTAGSWCMFTLLLTIVSCLTLHMA